LDWTRTRLGKGLDGRDNVAVGWSEPTTKKNADGYGRYLAWLNRHGLLIEDEPVTERITPHRLPNYIGELKSHLSSVSVGTTIGALCSATRALRPDADWSWLSRRSTRLKLKAKPSREKRHAMQHTLDLYRFGKWQMDNADRGKGRTIHAAQRYQSGMIVALLAARPLRIRNFQAITIGESLRWDGLRYWLVFSTDATKMRRPIEEPLPDDLIPYLEDFLRTWRPVLLHQAKSPASMGRQIRAADARVLPAKPDRTLHQERIRHRRLAPLVPRLPADLPSCGPAGADADQRHPAWPPKLHDGREALQPGAHARRQPAVWEDHIRDTADPLVRTQGSGGRVS
jgi:hypothetical protein